jgi:hypothetical protein
MWLFDCNSLENIVLTNPYIMKRLFIFTIIAAVLATSTVSVTSAERSPVEHVVIVNHEPVLLQSIADIQVAPVDKTLGCVCTAPFKRWWWSNLYWRQCYETGGAHEIWDESGTCAQSSCFPSTQCGATS